MKASGNYAGAGGSVDYGKTDYQEHRKDTAMSGGVVIAIIAVIAVIAWLFWDRLNAQFQGLTAINPLQGISDFSTGLVNGAGAMVNARQADAVSRVVNGANHITPTVSEARNNLGEYYPIKTLTSKDYDQMLTDAGAIPKAIVQAGNVITPNEILTAAAGKGAEAANTVNRLGLNNAYWELPDIQRGLVTLGEGIGMTFGVDLIQMGANNRAVDWPSPFGDNLRLDVGSVPVPANGKSNMDAWSEFYAGVT